MQSVPIASPSVPTAPQGRIQRTYPLGYSDGEFKRLEQQDLFLIDLTEDVLRRAGVAPGMRVLDVGCGVGSVSQLAAWLVGPSGAVLGIDRSREAIDSARRRTAAAGQHWAHFATVELESFSADETFDAVVGRLILTYLPDPIATLRRICRHVRPGGIIAFQEMTIPLLRSIPEGPQFRQCMDWIRQTLERSGADLDMGGRLFATFLTAGLPAPRMIAAGRVEGGPQSPIYNYLAETLRSLLPMAERVGVATPAEVEIDSMAERLRQEALESNACLMPPPLIGAWARKPAPWDRAWDRETRRGVNAD